MKITNEFKAAVEKAGWTVESFGDAALKMNYNTTHAPEGQQEHYTFVADVPVTKSCRYQADSFDVKDYALSWEAMREKGSASVPSPEAVKLNSEEIAEALNRLADAVQNAWPEGAEEEPSVMFVVNWAWYEAKLAAAKKQKA